MEGMDKIDLGKMSDVKLSKTYNTFMLMADSPKYKSNPAVKPLAQKLRDEMVKRGLRNNEADENKCNAAPVGHGVDSKMISRRTDPKKTVGRYKDFSFVLWRYHTASGFVYQVVCDELDIETKNHPTAEAAMRDFTSQVKEIEKDVRGNSKENSKTFLDKYSYKGVDCVLKSVRMEPTKARPEGYTNYEAICQDLGLRSKVTDKAGDAKAQLAKQIDESIKDKDNSKENSMDKLTAMKKKILLSNASDTVKAKALKKVMSNAALDHNEIQYILVLVHKRLDELESMIDREKNEERKKDLMQKRQTNLAVIRKLKS